jgi:hypothetical protein
VLECGHLKVNLKSRTRRIEQSRTSVNAEKVKNKRD